MPQILIDRSNPAYWTATFNNPPINLVGPDMVDELAALVDELETDPQVKVIVFRSANPDFFIAHWDIASDVQRIIDKGNGPTGQQYYLDTQIRLSRVPVATIAEIDGRARGGGSEIALSCDMRFGSIEGAILGQFEVGAGAVPGGNPMARLAQLAGRGRALEVILGSDDIDGATAERYGYINRALPRAELASFVDRLATRIAGFDKDSIARAKTFVDEVSLPNDELFGPALQAFFEQTQRPDSMKRLQTLAGRGLQTHSDTELNLGRAVAEV